MSLISVLTIKTFIDMETPTDAEKFIDMESPFMESSFNRERIYDTEWDRSGYYYYYYYHNTITRLNLEIGVNSRYTIRDCMGQVECVDEEHSIYGSHS